MESKQARLTPRVCAKSWRGIPQNTCRISEGAFTEKDPLLRISSFPTRPGAEPWLCQLWYNWYLHVSYLQCFRSLGSRWWIVLAYTWHFAAFIFKRQVEVLADLRPSSCLHTKTRPIYTRHVALTALCAVNATWRSSLYINKRQPKI